MVTAKHPFGVGHDPGGGVDGDFRPFGKPNSNRRVPYSKVLTRGVVTLRAGGARARPLFGPGKGKHMVGPPHF